MPKKILPPKQLLSFGELVDIEKLPKLIARKKIKEYFGDIISPKTVANHDQKGIGPKLKKRLGKDVYYEKHSFIEYLDSLESHYKNRNE